MSKPPRLDIWEDRTPEQLAADGDMPLPSAGDLIRQIEFEATDPEHIALGKRLFAERDAAIAAKREIDKRELRQLIRIMWGLPPKAP